MAIHLSILHVKELVKARQEAHLTQMELSNLAKVSLRTIKDLESGRRKIFYESTIISVCRALNISYTELIGPSSSAENEGVIAGTKKGRSLLVASFVIAFSIFLFAVIYYLSIPREGARLERADYTRPCDELVPNINNPVWLGNDSIYVYYYLLESNQLPRLNEEDYVEIKWAYHFVPGSMPVYCVNAFTSWDPDHDIRIFKKTIWGDSTEIFKFSYTAPSQPGMYMIRVFFVPAYDFIPSFYGKPPLSQVVAPSFGRFVQIPIEVLPK